MLAPPSSGAVVRRKQVLTEKVHDNKEAALLLSVLLACRGPRAQNPIGSHASNGSEDVLASGVDFPKRWAPSQLAGQLGLNGQDLAVNSSKRRCRLAIFSYGC
jgi:hypothetical protein